jgi:hypothetical protein
MGRTSTPKTMIKVPRPRGGGGAAIPTSPDSQQPWGIANFLNESPDVAPFNGIHSVAAPRNTSRETLPPPPSSNRATHGSVQ